MGSLEGQLTPFLRNHAELNSISKSNRNTFLGKSLTTVSNLSAQRLKLIRKGIHKLRGNKSQFKSSVGLEPKER